MPLIRCFFYTSDGLPIKGSHGCQRASCTYVHPVDRDWDRAAPSNRRPRQFEDSSERGWGIRYSRSPSPKRSPFRRRRSRDRWPSPSPSTHSGRSTSRVAELDSRKNEPPSAKGIQHSSSTNSNNAGTEPTRSTTPTGPLLNRKSRSSGPSIPGTSTASRPKTPEPSSSFSISSSPPTAPKSLLAISSKRVDNVPSVTPPVIIPHKPTPPLPPSDPPRQPSMSPPSSSPMPPPPPPDAPAPPLPIPEIPKQLTIKPPSPPPELTVEEKRKLWEDRIKLFADVYLAKETLADREKDHQFALDIVNSNYFSTFDDDEKTRIQNDLASTTVAKDKANAEFESAQAMLLDQGTWPIVPPPENPLEEEQRQQHGEILKYVQGLGETVEAMNKLLGNLPTLKQPPSWNPLQPQKEYVDPDEEGFDDAMDLDEDEVPGAASSAPPPTLASIGQTSTSSRPSLPTRKRRRVDGESNEAGPSAQPNDIVQPAPSRPVVQDPDLPTREEVEELLERLINMENQAFELDQQATIYEQAISDEFDSRLDHILEDHSAEKKKKEKEKEEAQKQARSKEIERVTMESNRLGTDVTEMATHLSSLLEKVELMETKLDEERSMRDQGFTQVIEFEERLKKFQESRDANQRTIQTLEAALKAYQTAPSPPPTPPTQISLPTPEYILSGIQDQLIEAVRQSLQPMAEQYRKDVDDLVKANNKDVLEKVWPRMDLVMKLLATAADKLEIEQKMVLSRQKPNPVPQITTSQQGHSQTHAQQPRVALPPNAPLQIQQPRTQYPHQVQYNGSASSITHTTPGSVHVPYNPEIYSPRQHQFQQRGPSTSNPNGTVPR
ncbi:hypothetical protein CPB83DRAFT_882892 [Crepidotus variabilis]|uniref:Uncharacterized protein n=1 Tax=Crepidotus variabilis TaxID=179855 RepID=A0A9P6EIH7_9AGAR|nr:hypothetical protein CPB83DRAFT_882892 [Crepidotus variabilis]